MLSNSAADKPEQIVLDQFGDLVVEPAHHHRVAPPARLDQLGVSIAMDDFGTGYSSLSYLTRFPVKKIKIDRSFIDTLGTSPQTSAIVSSIVGLGQSLHVTITAEGVETEGQAAMLRKWGCDQVQGYYYGRPEAQVSENEASDAPLGTQSSDDAGSTPREDNPLRRPLVA